MVFYVTVVTFFQAKDYHEELKPVYQPFGPVKYFEYILNFGLFIFAYCALPAFHQVYTIVKMPTIRRIQKIGLRTNLFLMVFYMAFTVAAYYSLGPTMQDKAFDIFPNKKPPSTDPHNVYMSILKVILLFTLITSFLVNSIPLKAQILAETNTLMTNKSNAMVALIICGIAGFLSYVYPKITSWFSILGALGSTSMIVLLPALCYYKGYKDDPDHKWAIRFTVVWGTVTSSLAFSCLIATMVDMAGLSPNW